MELTGLSAVAFGVAAAGALVLTPAVRRLACRLRILDEPDGLRKLHDRPVPTLGGLAVYLAVIGTLPMLAAVRGATWSDELAQVRPWSAIATAATIICAVGILDDIVHLRALTKLLSQVAVAAVLYAGGIKIQRIELLGMTWDLGWAAFPFTAFWLLGSMNSLNLLDGMDGLAPGIGAIMAGCITLVALSTGAGHAALAAASLAGALVGFLFYNFPPASIFLGDAGSLLIGLLIGALAIKSSLQAPATVALVVPVAVLTIPILDVSVAIVRRWSLGLPLHSADRGHIHHRLQHAGLSRVQTLACLCGLTLVACAGALLSLFFHNDLIAVLVSMAVAAGLIVSRVFGHMEFSFLRQQVSMTAALVTDGLTAGGAVLVRTRTRLAACQGLDEAWVALRAAAGELDVERLEIETTPLGLTEPHSRWCASLALDKDHRISAALKKGRGETTRRMLRRLGLVLTLMEQFRTHYDRLRNTEQAVILPYPSSNHPITQLSEAS